MKIRIHFSYSSKPPWNGAEDSIDLEGETVEDIRDKWDEYAKDKPVGNPWSEEIK